MVSNVYVCNVDIALGIATVTTITRSRTTWRLLTLTSISRITVRRWYSNNNVSVCSCIHGRRRDIDTLGWYRVHGRWLLLWRRHCRSSTPRFLPDERLHKWTRWSTLNDRVYVMAKLELKHNMRLLWQSLSEPDFENVKT